MKLVTKRLDILEAHVLKAVMQVPNFLVACGDEQLRIPLAYSWDLTQRKPLLCTLGNSVLLGCTFS